MADADLHDVAGAHLVFCSMAGSTVHLDCLSETEGTQGWPFTLVVHVPAGAEWSTIAARTLGRWTSDATPLDLQLETNRSPERLRISDGQNALRLDVVDIRIESIA